MVNDDTEVLFPSRIIPQLRSLRGGEWNVLLDRVIRAQATDRDHLAFVLLMVKLCACTSCSADSFRGMRGCTTCAKTTLKRFRGDDEELLRLYREAEQEVSGLMPG